MTRRWIARPIENEEHRRTGWKDKGPGVAPAGRTSGRAQRKRRMALCLVIPLLFAFMSFGLTTLAAQVTLTWEENSEPHLGGYKVYYGTASGDYDWSIDVGKATTYTVRNLADGVTYYFASKAYTTNRKESAFSDEAAQNGCTYAISATDESFTSSGGSGTVLVTTQSGCTWTAASNASWLTITSGAAGSGSGTVKYSVARNTGSSSRTAGCTFAKNVLTVTQSGTQSYTITASAGTGGTISPSGSISVSRDSSKTFTISPKTGYRIAAVYINGVSKGAISSYTFSNVTTKQTIKAVFKVK